MQKILGHHSILTTTRYTHLTSHTAQTCSVCIDALMRRYTDHQPRPEGFPIELGCERQRGAVF